MSWNEIELLLWSASFIGCGIFAGSAVLLAWRGRYAEAAYWMAFAAWVRP